MSRLSPILFGALFLLSYAANGGRCGTAPAAATRGVVPTISELRTASALVRPDTLSAITDTGFAALLTPAAIAPAVIPSAVTAPADNSGESCLFTPITALSFGAIFTSPLPGTIVVNPDGSANYTGGVYAHTGIAGGTPYAAEIELTLGNPQHCTQDDHCATDNNECDRNEDDDNAVNDHHQTFTRHGMNCSLVISSPTTLTRSGGTETMTADTYTISRNKGDISIGATLHVSANQASGSYSGVFFVTLSYQ